MNTYTINTSDTLFIRKEKSKRARESKGERANITLQCHCTTALHCTPLLSNAWNSAVQSPGRCAKH